jgi:hypothetical protein
VRITEYRFDNNGIPVAFFDARLICHKVPAEYRWVGTISHIQRIPTFVAKSRHPPHCVQINFS